MAASNPPAAEGQPMAISLPPEASKAEHADFARGVEILAALLAALPAPSEAAAAGHEAGAR